MQLHGYLCIELEFNNVVSDIAFSHDGRTASQEQHCISNELSGRCRELTRQHLCVLQSAQLLLTQFDAGMFESHTECD
jgi:hypothetical protein